MLREGERRRVFCSGVVVGDHPSKVASASETCFGAALFSQVDFAASALDDPTAEAVYKKLFGHHGNVKETSAVNEILKKLREEDGTEEAYLVVTRALRQKKTATTALLVEGIGQVLYEFAYSLLLGSSSSYYIDYQSIEAKCNDGNLALATTGDAGAKGIGIERILGGDESKTAIGHLLELLIKDRSFDGVGIAPDDKAALRRLRSSMDRWFSVHGGKKGGARWWRNQSQRSNTHTH